MINARDMGYMTSYIRREFSDEEIDKIAGAYKNWQSKDSDETNEKYEDIPDFCRSVKIEEIREHEHDLTPKKYVAPLASEDELRRLENVLAGDF